MTFSGDVKWHSIRSKVQEVITDQVMSYLYRERVCVNNESSEDFRGTMPHEQDGYSVPMDAEL